MDEQWTNGGFTYRVSGLRQTARALQEMGVEAEDLKGAMHRVGLIVASSVKSKIPVLTGRLAGSVRASKAKTKVVVRAGGARAVYAGVQNYGMYNNIQAKYFMQEGLEEKRGEAIAELEKELQNLMRKVGLK